jgi:hypothetical protein
LAEAMAKSTFICIEHGLGGVAVHTLLPWKPSRLTHADVESVPEVAQRQRAELHNPPSACIAEELQRSLAWPCLVEALLLHSFRRSCASKAAAIAVRMAVPTANNSAL